MINGFICERCNHNWVPRKNETPKVCPRCKSPYWNTPRKAYRPERKQRDDQLVHDDHLNTNNFPFRTVAHNSPDAHSNKNSIHHKENKLKSSHGTSDQRLFNESKAVTKRNNRMASKLEEISRLAKLYFHQDAIDNMLKNLSLFAKSSGREESFIDEYLEKLHSDPKMMNVFRELLALNPSVSNTPATGQIRLHPRLEHLPQDAMSKLAEIELVLKPYYAPHYLWDTIEGLIERCIMAGDNSFLDGALEFYKREANYYDEMRRFY